MTDFELYEYSENKLKEARKRIEELEKENAELKADNNARRFAMAMSEKVEKQLREENAELKKDKEELCHSISEGGKACVYLNDQLTKAKEIIKKFSEFANLEVEYDPEHPQKHTDLWNELCKEAEQFISEVEK